MHSSLHALASHARIVAVGSTGSTGTGSSGGGGSSFTTLIPLLLIAAAIFYFLILRPQRNRQRTAQQTNTELQPGVEILTRAGQYATVVSVDDDGMVLEIAPGVHSRFVKEAVGRILAPDEPQADADAGLGADGGLTGPPAIESIPDQPDPDDADDPAATGEHTATDAADDGDVQEEGH